MRSGSLAKRVRIWCMDANSVNLWLMCYILLHDHVIVRLAIAILGSTNLNGVVCSCTEDVSAVDECLCLHRCDLDGDAVRRKAAQKGGAGVIFLSFSLSASSPSFLFLLPLPLLLLPLSSSRAHCTHVTPDKTVFV